MRRRFVGAAAEWGQLGDGLATLSSVPTAVTGGHKFRQLSVGSNNLVCGVTTTGRVLCWGLDLAGSLGAPSGEVCVRGDGLELQCATTPSSSRRMSASWRLLPDRHSPAPSRCPCGRSVGAGTTRASWAAPQRRVALRGISGDRLQSHPDAGLGAPEIRDGSCRAPARLRCHTGR